MSAITDEEWHLLKEHFGDLAYEEPHNHRRYLTAIREALKDDRDDPEK
jgi:hypothetical protein